MMSSDALFKDSSALIIDGSSTARHSMQLALNHLGVRKVATASRAVDAKRQLAQRTYDIILCDYNFDHGLTGRDLFQELRHSRALPLATIFFMITSEASLSKVAEVAEIAPDDYLIKPINAVVLEERLTKAKLKKDALAALYVAYEKDDFQQSIEIGNALLAQAGFPHRMDVSRFVAQAHLALDQTDQAVALYDKVLEKKAVPWARLGVFGSDAPRKATDKPGSALRNIVSESATYLDAYDKLARLRVKEGRFSEALGIYERALKASPNHVDRLQVAGQLSFILGNTQQGIAFLGRALTHAGSGTALDLRSMLHLTLMYFDNADVPNVTRVANALRDAQDRDQVNFRTQTLSRLGSVCAHLASRQLSQAVNEIRQVSMLGIDERLSFELACDILAVLDRMYARDVHTDLDQWTAQLARRFCVSTQSSALMKDIMRQSPALAQIIMENSASIQTLANEGMQLLVAGQFKDAAIRLLEYGEDTFNARLLAIACNAGARCAQESEDETVARAAARAYELIQRMGEGGLHLPQELADRVHQYGASLQAQFIAPVTEIAQAD